MVNAGTLIGTEFGRALRREREARSRSLDWLSAETKVGMAHLRALEQGNVQDLPGGVFRRGIVRAYLQAVGLEEESWMPRFQEVIAAESKPQANGANGEAWEEFAENVRRGRSAVRQTRGWRWLGLAMLAVLVVTMALTVWYLEITPIQRRSTPEHDVIPR